MSRLFCIGDSFCEYNDNWIKEVSEGYNLEVLHLGTSSSSLTYGITQFYNIVKNFKINSDDRFIYCITSKDRYTSHGLHISPAILNDKLFNSEKFTDFLTLFDIKSNRHLKLDRNRNHPDVRELKDVYSRWLYLIEDENTSGLYGESVISHMLNTLLSSIPTDRIAIFQCFNDLATFGRPFKNLSDYLPSNHFNKKPLLDFLKDSLGIGEDLSKYYAPRNHMNFEEQPFLRELFLKEYGEYLDNTLNEGIPKLQLRK